MNGEINGIHPSFTMTNPPSVVPPKMTLDTPPCTWSYMSVDEVKSFEPPLSCDPEDDPDYAVYRVLCWTCVKKQSLPRPWFDVRKRHKDFDIEQHDLIVHGICHGCLRRNQARLAILDAARCSQCQTIHQLKRCKGCYRVYYCSQTCANEDWGRHREACGAISKTFQCNPSTKLAN